MADDNGSSTAIVAVIAIIVIVAIGFFVFRMVPGMGGDGASDINVEVPNLGGGDGE